MASDREAAEVRDGLSAAAAQVWAVSGRPWVLARDQQAAAKAVVAFLRQFGVADRFSPHRLADMVEEVARAE